MTNQQDGELPPWLKNAIENVEKNYKPYPKNVRDELFRPMYPKVAELPSSENADDAEASRKQGACRHEKKLKYRASNKGKGKGKDRKTENVPAFEKQLGPAAPSKPAPGSSRDLRDQFKSSVKINPPNTKVAKPTLEETSPSPSNHTGLPSPSLALPESFNSLFVSETSATPTTTYNPPQWYQAVSTTGPTYKLWVRTRNTQAEQSLLHMKGCIDRCETETNPDKLNKIFVELWNEIHKAEVKLVGIDARLLRKNMMLGRGQQGEDQGLLRILNSKKVEYPPDLRADAIQLYHRWCRQVFDLDLLHHIVRKRTANRTSDSIVGDWVHSADFYGEGDLIMGQWWPTQLCTVRDGAHGAAQGGIYGQTGKGAYSIVVAGGGGYNDEDNGDEIWYSGTVSRDPIKLAAKNMSKKTSVQSPDTFLATDNTQRLIESCDTIGEPVRVIRSHNLPKSDIYRPLVGFRYDGLYKVVEYEITDNIKGSYRFRLLRCPGQSAIRWANNAARRPTKYEVEEYKKLKLDG
ncbi:hypothetical protein K504DRAFT_504449 [Pleomassaria siparia CBS 279.74]|uniref:YDG domain-containing protein n=1 Tax=Pleomassaria siparia CBS 279.74 TaxID=1314801 RepID=A0A6G1K4A0_9PLEO|nr:hypothetical protein K504DRAFT_504449 [Pleomassaria siparia CBS 279.74]